MLITALPAILSPASTNCQSFDYRHAKGKYALLQQKALPLIYSFHCQPSAEQGPKFIRRYHPIWNLHSIASKMSDSRYCICPDSYTEDFRSIVHNAGRALYFHTELQGRFICTYGDTSHRWYPLWATDADYWSSSLSFMYKYVFTKIILWQEMAFVKIFCLIMSSLK